MGIFGKDKIKVKKRSAGMMAYIEFKGPYDKIPFDDIYRRLYDWAKESKARPGFRPFAVYSNDPNVTPEAERITLVAIPIGRAAEPKGDVKVKELPEMEVAVMKHDAPAEDYGKSYAELGKWIAQNGYEVTCAPMEIYTGKPKLKNGKMIIYSEIHFPVKKK